MKNTNANLLAHKVLGHNFFIMLAFLFLQGNLWAMDDGILMRPFITTWKTTANNEEIIIPTALSETYNYTVNWGDGTTTTETGDATHAYTNAGTYTVSITGTFPRINFFGNTLFFDRSKIQTIEQWGDIAWTSMESAFYGCENLTYNATDAPDLSRVTSLEEMFAFAEIFNGDLNNWNTANVTNMKSMFENAFAFNGDISTWNTVNVTNMEDMFAFASSFNGDVSNWNTAKVEIFTGMFNGASAFNGDVSNWNTANAVRMTFMFSNATSFNGNLNSWNTAKVTSMSYMFRGASSFNGNLSSWNTAKVEDMAFMFTGATSFNGDISNWNTAKVESMTGMFIDATQFNGDLSSWNTGKVTGMLGMFQGATNFNSNISNWDTKNVEIMSLMFENASSFNQSLGRWDITKLENIGALSPIFNMLNNSGIDVTNYDKTLIGWANQNVSNNLELGAANLEYCLAEPARNFLINDKGWTINGDNLQSGCDQSAFITTWKTTNAFEFVTIPTFSGIFYEYVVDWGDGTTPSMPQFGNATHTYTAPGTYTVTITGTFPRIDFSSSTSANRNKIQTIEQWGNRDWTSMERAFFGCQNLTSNAPLPPNLSGLTDLAGMFQNASAFTGDLSRWNTETVTDMSRMFLNASAFNSDISGWNTSKVTNMFGMFQSASTFNQNLGAWDMTKVTTLSGMLNESGLDVPNYDNTLIGWAAQNVPNNNSLGADNLQYCLGETARNTLINDKNWTFLGDSKATNDMDNDGFSGCEGDCDDTNADINPNAIEFCDGIDNNCDGNTDEFGTNATIIYVKAGSTGDGSSWAKALGDLQDAIDLGCSCNVTEIWVAEGTYLPSKDSTGNATPSDPRNATFYMNKDLQFFGGFPNTGDPTMADRNVVAFKTILSGDIGTIGNKADNAYTIVHTKHVNSTFLMDGFTLRDGNANGTGPLFINLRRQGGAWYNDGNRNGNSSHPTVRNCIFLENNSNSFGGAFFSDGSLGGSSSPTFEKCSFSGNTASFSAGVVYIDGLQGSSSPTFTDCDFVGNSANSGGAIVINSDEGIAKPTFTRCLFSENNAENNGGAIRALNENGTSSQIFTQCIFSKNMAGVSGGAIYNTIFGFTANLSTTFTKCSFSENSASDGGAISTSATLSLYSSNLTNCIFSKNSAMNDGGAIFDVGGASTLTNCSFSKNTADEGGAINSSASDNTLINCIFWDNGDEFAQNSSSTTLNHSIFDDGNPNGTVNLPTGVTGNNNLDADPFFVDAANGNLRLQTSSPAIDAGTATGAPAEDFDGNSRPFGSGVDMGAFESQINCTTLITGQTTTICSGDMVDLSTLITGTPENTLAFGTTYGAYGTTSMQSPTMTTTYFARDSNATTTCADTAMITVMVSQPATVANAGPDQSQANNGNFTLAANNPTVGNGMWSVVTGTATITNPNSNTSTVTGVPAGTAATLRWTITNGACTSFDDVNLVNDANGTTAVAGADQTQCNNGNFTMSANNPTTGTGMWSLVSGTATITNSNSNTTTVTDVPTGTAATLRWTITNGTNTNSDEVVLTNEALPTNATAGTDQTQCNTSSFTLAGNNPTVGTGTWSVVGGSATITTPNSPTSSVTGITVGNAVTLRWTISNGTCPLSTDDVVLTNDALPTMATAGTDQTQCNTSTFTLAGNNPTVGTGTWSVVSGSATITNPNNPTSSVTGIAAGTTATLRWTISNGTCPNSMDDVLLTNDAPPTPANAGTDQIKCNTSTFTMAANTPTVGTGIWSVVSGTATIATPNSPTTNVNVTIGNTAVLRWTISNGTCPSSTDDVVLINDAPPSTANAGADQTKCNTNTFTMAANAPTVGTGTWSVVSGNAIIATPNSPTTNVTVAAGNTATLRWTISNGICPPSTEDVILTNDAPPSTANAGPDQTKCNTNTFTMAANSPTVGTGTWSVVSGNATIATPNSSTTTVTVAAGNTATLRWTISNATCPSSTDEVVLKNDVCTLSIAATTQATEDAMDGIFTITTSRQFATARTVNITIGGTATNGTDYANIPTTFTFPANANTATITVDVTADNLVEGNETVIATLANGTGYTVGNPNTATVTITDNDVGTLSIAATTQAAEDASNGVFTVTTSKQFTTAQTVNITIGGTATNGTDYANIPTTFTIPANANTATITVDVTADNLVEGNETVIATLANGTGYTVGNPSTATVNISDDEAPCPSGANAGANQLNVCGNTVTLNANVPDRGMGTWTATPAGGSFGNVNTPNTTFSGSNGVTYTLTWTIVAAGCPTTSDQVIIQFNGDTDGDTVQDCNDFCPNGDDRINTDGQGIADACDCDPNDPSDEFVNVPGLVFIDSVITPGTYQSSFEITSYGKVNGGNTVILKAGKSITLTEGFFARLGSEFSALIELCRTPAAIVETEIAAQSRTKPTTELTELDWWVGPNPYTDSFTITCQFPKDMEKVSLWVYDNMGKLVKTVVLEEPVPAGKFQRTVADDMIPTGINYVVLKTATDTRVKKIIKVK